MKATLIKKAEGWYNLYQDKIGIGSTHAELQGYKLCKQNCDEIFEVFNVKKLSKSTYPGKINGKRRDSFISGFNKAIRLNKDKQFTEDDVITAIVHHTYLLYNDGKGYEDGDNNDDRIDYVIAALKQKTTEIEVEVEMECKIGCEHNVFNGENSSCCGDKIPKIDENRCLILKKRP